ncbi:MAG: hypothetical protein AB1480_05245 [Nitrospirota bacterium]
MNKVGPAIWADFKDGAEAIIMAEKNLYGGHSICTKQIFFYKGG